jgi:hypothetical protein
LRFTDRSGRAAPLESVKPGEQLRNGDIQLGRYALIEVDLHQQADQFSRLVDIDAGFPRTLDDRLGQRTTALRHHLRRGIAGTVGERDRKRRLRRRRWRRRTHLTAT